MILSFYQPFRHWSESGSVYLLSDLHLDDPDCKLMDANWIEPEKQIEIINKCVGKSDTFICLGDVGNPEYVLQIKAGLKVLLLGNHDARGKYKEVFDEVYEGPLFISDRILLSHEPILGFPFCLNIHGHDHSGTEDYEDGGYHLNIAANVCGYTPENLGKIIKDGVLSSIKNIHHIAIDERL